MKKMFFRNKQDGVFVTYKVPSSGGKADPQMTALFQHKGCQRQFILEKLTLLDKDSQYRLPSSDINKNLCSICCCCSYHFSQHKCTDSEKDMIKNILKLD